MRGRDGFCIPCQPGEVGEAIGRISAVDAASRATRTPTATEKKILRDVFEKGDAYFRTGDLLRMDADGYFYFVDRIGDTFRWKGENVSTSEVAEVLSVAAGRARGERLRRGGAGPGRPRRHGRAGGGRRGFDPEPRCTRTSRASCRPMRGRCSCAIGAEIEITGTFKHRKVELVKQGFDPAAITDPLYFLDGERRLRAARRSALRADRERRAAGVRDVRLGVCGALLLAQAAAGDPASERLHREAIVIDGHNDVTSWILDYRLRSRHGRRRSGEAERRGLWMLAGRCPSRRGDELRTHTDLRRLQRGGVDAQFFSIWPHSDYAKTPGASSSARTR